MDCLQTAASGYNLHRKSDKWRLSWKQKLADKLIAAARILAVFPCSARQGHFLSLLLLDRRLAVQNSKQCPYVCNADADDDHDHTCGHVHQHDHIHHGGSGDHGEKRQGQDYDEGYEHVHDEDHNGGDYGDDCE